MENFAEKSEKDILRFGLSYL